MIQAVETTKATNGGKVWFIDVIGDKSSIDKGHLLSSVLWNMVPVYSAMVEDSPIDTFLVEFRDRQDIGYWEQRGWRMDAWIPT